MREERKSPKMTISGSYLSTQAPGYLGVDFKGLHWDRLSQHRPSVEGPDGQPLSLIRILSVTSVTSSLGNIS